MIGSLLLLLAFQATSAQQTSLASAAEAPVQEQGAADETAPVEAAPPQVERKRICRTVVDTRTGIMGKRSKVCRFADEPPAR